MALILKRIFVISLVWGLAGGAAAEEFLPIGDIRFVGNERTKPKIMLQEMVVEIGDPADPDLIEQSRQAIMDLGLFKSVVAELLPSDGVGLVLQISVSEKYYIIPLPRLDRSEDGDLSWGGQLRLDNLGGLNQRLRLNYRAERGCCGTDRTVNTYSMSYNYPRIAGTIYGLDFAVAHQAAPQADKDLLGNVVSEYVEENDSVGIGIWRWLKKEGPSSGWSVGVSTFWQHLGYGDQHGIPVMSGPEKAVGVAALLRYTEVNDLLYSRKGVEYGFSTEQGSVGMGSDTPYSRNQFFYRRYWPVGLTLHTNMNFQMRLGTTGGTVPIADHPYSLGGARDIRGYEKDAFEGRSFFVMNVEYLRPVWDNYAARGVAFLDIGNAYDDNRIIDFGDVESSAGLGFRYRLKSFVNFQLRIDYSYAFGLSDAKFYIGSKNTF